MYTQMSTNCVNVNHRIRPNLESVIHRIMFYGSLVSFNVIKASKAFKNVSSNYIYCRNEFCEHSFHGRPIVLLQRFPDLLTFNVKLKSLQ